MACPVSSVSNSRRVACSSPRQEALTRDGDSLIRGGHRSPLQLQRDSALGGRVPVQSGGLASGEGVAAIGDLERVVRRSDEGREGAEGEHDSTHGG